MTGVWLTFLLVGAASGLDAQAPSRKPPEWPATLPPGQWVMAGGDYALARFSPLNLITPDNVPTLRPVWSFSTGLLRAHEGNPLVVGSVMYVHTPFPNAVFALDLAKPGAPMLWSYAVPAPVAKTVPPTGCCDVGSRGLAYHPSGKLYVPLLHGELAALDAQNGREIWRVKNADPRLGATMSAAPIVIRDLVIVGISGAEYGVRGYLTAYDARTGQLRWRAYSTGPDAEVLLDGDANPQYPSHTGRDLGMSSWGGDEWRRGGGTTSGWISYDPELDLLYYGTDEPAAPGAARRPGDNKWTSTIFARVAATGKVRWAYQVTPHDEWGYGAANESILADLKLGSELVKTLVHFDRNGFAYTLDRATGSVLLAEKYGPTNWASRVDPGSGLPLREPRYGTESGQKVARICPGAIGQKFLQPAAFSPVTSMFYVPVINLCMDFQAKPSTYVAGQPYGAAAITMAAGPGGNRGRFIAWDATTGAITWEVKEPFAVSGGALATAGGLVFYGTMEGWLKALDQKTGQEVWRFKTPSGIVGSPITFSGTDGKQYLAVLSGIGGWLGLGANGAFPDLASVTNLGGVLTVFGL